MLLRKQQLCHHENPSSDNDLGSTFFSQPLPHCNELSVTVVPYDTTRRMFSSHCVGNTRCLRCHIIYFPHNSPVDIGAPRNETFFSVM